MKAIVLSHTSGGSYLLDNTGSYHFSKSYAQVPIGTEVELKANHDRGKLVKCFWVAAIITATALTISHIAKKF